MVEEVRGRGLMAGVVLRVPVAGVVEALLREGLVTCSAGERCLRLLPPFVISAAEIDRALEILDAALGRLALPAAIDGGAGRGAATAEATP